MLLCQILATTWKNIKKTYKHNKFKISIPTWNEEFELTKLEQELEPELKSESKPKYRKFSLKSPEECLNEIVNTEKNINEKYLKIILNTKTHHLY